MLTVCLVASVHQNGMYQAAMPASVHQAGWHAAARLVLLHQADMADMVSFEHPAHLYQEDMVASCLCKARTGKLQTNRCASLQQIVVCNLVVGSLKACQRHSTACSNRRQCIAWLDIVRAWKAPRAYRCHSCVPNRDAHMCAYCRYALKLRAAAA